MEVRRVFCGSCEERGKNVSTYIDMGEIKREVLDEMEDMCTERENSHAEKR